MNADPFMFALTQFGGLGALALFAYLLLKSVLKQQEKLSTLLDNHLGQLLQRQELGNRLLEQLVKTMEAHESRAAAHYQVVLEALGKGNPQVG